LNKNYILFKK